MWHFMLIFVILLCFLNPNFPLSLSLSYSVSSDLKLIEFTFRLNAHETH